MLGEWQGIGKGSFPGIDNFEWEERTTIRMHGSEPALIFRQETMILGERGEHKKEGHWEAGVIRVLEDGTLSFPSVQDSGRVEVRIDKPDGEIIGNIFLEAPASNTPNWKNLTIALKPRTTSHDLYFLFNSRPAFATSWHGNDYEREVFRLRQLHFRQ